MSAALKQPAPIQTLLELRLWLHAWGRASCGPVGPMGYPSASIEFRGLCALTGALDDDDNRPEILLVENALTALGCARWDGPRRLLAIKLRYLYRYRTLEDQAKLLKVRKCECEAYIDETERMVLDVLDAMKC